MKSLRLSIEIQFKLPVTKEYISLGSCCFQMDNGKEMVLDFNETSYTYGEKSLTIYGKYENKEFELDENGYIPTDEMLSDIRSVNELFIYTDDTMPLPTSQAITSCTVYLSTLSDEVELAADGLTSFGEYYPNEIPEETY